MLHLDPKAEAVLACAAAAACQEFKDLPPDQLLALEMAVMLRMGVTSLNGIAAGLTAMPATSAELQEGLAIAAIMVAQPAQQAILTHLEKRTLALLAAYQTRGAA